MNNRLPNKKKFNQVNSKKRVKQDPEKRGHSKNRAISKISPHILPGVAIIISIISLIFSIKQTKIQDEYLKVNISFSAHEINNSRVLLFPIDDPLYDFSQYSEELPYIKGFLVFDVELEVANLSLRKVSIGDISAYPVFKNTNPDIYSNWIPVYNVSYFTDVQFTDFLSTEKNIKLNLPIVLDSGESITIKSKISWPLDNDMVNLIDDYLAINNKATLIDVKYLLGQNNTDLGMGSIETTNIDGTAVPLFLALEDSKLFYYFDLYSSFGTEHEFYLDLKSSLEDLFID